MANHSFSFDGGDVLRAMGATWFVSYAYYETIDRAHSNWSKVSTAGSRIPKYNSSRRYHKQWLQEVIVMNPTNLNRNTINLEANITKKMARDLLEKLI